MDEDDNPATKLFRQAFENDAAVPVDLNADFTEAGGITLVCSCGMNALHEGRCARCGVRNGQLVCGKANNHRGPHQSIVIWR